MLHCRRYGRLTTPSIYAATTNFVSDASVPAVSSPPSPCCVPVTKICPRCAEEYDDSTAFCAKDGTRLVARGQQTDLIGSIIADRYRIVSSIGEGGMGHVYLAEHVRMKRKSAIKIMRRALVHDVEALQRFTREAENASQIAHPNVAAIFDFGETNDGIVYLAMEYVDGESLANKLGRDFALHPDVAADILGQAADALQAAHDLGILHRDLKPDNIMLAKRPDRTYMVKLVDFGIARTMDGSDQKLTRTGFAIGTPAYMSPEQLAGDSLDARSDQYSLALVAFVALTGKDAFPAESSKESLIARLTSRPRTLQEAKEDVKWPGALQAIFDRALSPEPPERFPTVSDFAHALSTAISAMTPTQTAELYRRALDVRIANVAMRTPHSDLQALRTPNSPLATVTPPSAQPSIERQSAPGEEIDERRAAPREASPPRTVPASGAYAALTDSVPLPAPQRDPALSGGTPAYGASFNEDGVAPPADVPSNPRRRFPMVAIAGGIAAMGAVVWLFVQGAGPRTTPTPPPVGDSLAPVVVAAAVDTAPKTTVDTVVQQGAIRAPVVIASDSGKRRAERDSLKRLEKATADSIKTRAALIGRFPESAARAFIGADVDMRNYSVRNDDVRVMIMSPPVTLWRHARARAWKDANMRPDFGVPYEVVDPIEVWSAWQRTVSGRRAVYVIEAAPARAPWPSYKPEELFEIKRGDVTSIRVRRDGVDIPLGDEGQIPALVNESAHDLAKKPNPGQFVATLSPDAFALRADGTVPKVDIVIVDRSRSNGPVTLNVPERTVRRLWDEFQAYRAAIAQP